MADHLLFKKKMIFIQHSWSVIGQLMLACRKNDKTVDKGQKMFTDSSLEVYPLFCINLTCSNKKKYVYIKYKSLFLYSNKMFLQYDSVFFNKCILKR